MSSDAGSHSQATGALAEAPARYSDGASARAVTVQVRLLRDGLEVLEPGTSAARRWPIAYVKAATALSANTEDVLLRLDRRAPDGPSLFIKDPIFIRALTGIAPQLTTRAQRMRIARPLLGLALGIAALTVAGFYLGWSPARWVAGALPASVRDSLGDGVVASITGKRRECTRVDGRAAMDALVRRLTGPDGARYKVLVVDWSLVNAFAAPGDHIVMTRGTLAAATSPDEVAGVLAHEIGHSQSLDPETGIVRALGLTALIELISGGNSGSIGGLGLMLTQIGYTRAAEQRADRTAARLLQQAEISPMGLTEFFRRLARKQKGEDTSPLGDLQILSTHPPSEARARMFEQLPRYPTRPALDGDQWASLKAICER